MNKTIKLSTIVMLLLIFGASLAFADTFTSRIDLDSSTDSTYCQVNVTTEQNTQTFDCLRNLSDSFSFGLARDCSSSTINNLTAGIDELALTCNTLANQYSGISNYFKLYNNCSIEKTICINDKESLMLEPSFKPALESCNNELAASNKIVANQSTEYSGLKTDFDSCKSSLSKSNWKFYVGGGIGAILSFLLIFIIERFLIKDEN